MWIDPDEKQFLRIQTSSMLGKKIKQRKLEGNPIDLNSVEPVEVWKVQDGRASLEVHLVDKDVLAKWKKDNG